MQYSRALQATNDCGTLPRRRLLDVGTDRIGKCFDGELPTGNAVRRDDTDCFRKRFGICLATRRGHNDLVEQPRADRERRGLRQETQAGCNA